MKTEIPRHRKSRIPRGSRRIRDYTFALPLFAREALGLLAAAARGWRDDNAPRLGAALSFYSLLPFPPAPPPALLPPPPLPPPPSSSRSGAPGFSPVATRRRPDCFSKFPNSWEEA